MAKQFRGEIIEEMENGGYMHGRRLMCALLSNGFGGRDMSRLADNLLFTFPSVTAVLEADYPSLMTVEGMTRRTALYILALGEVKKKTGEPLARIKDSGELIAHARRALKDKDCEFAELYLVDRDGAVLNFYRFTSRLKTRVFMNAQEFINKIIAGKPYGFYVLHNHISDRPDPSAMDDKFTARLLVVCGESGVRFLDHCVVAGENSFSYRGSGRMDKLKSLVSRYPEE